MRNPISYNQSFSCYLTNFRHFLSIDKLNCYVTSNSYAQEYKQMLRTSFIRKYKKKVFIGLNKRFFTKTDLLNEVLILYEKKKKLQIKLEHLLSKSKNLDKFYKINSVEFKFKKEIKYLRYQLVDISESFSEKLLQIPNIPDECVKIGKSKEENELIYQEGDFPTPHFIRIKDLFFERISFRFRRFKKNNYLALFFLHNEITLSLCVEYVS